MTPDELARDLRAETSPHAVLAFLLIEHPNLVDPIRVVSDPIDYMLGGNLWIGCPFEVTPVTNNDQYPRAELRVQNVDRRIGEALLGVEQRARVSLEVRSSADFDLGGVPRTERPGGSIIYAFRHFELSDITVNPIEVTGTLILRDYSREPYPGKRATMSRCPGLFR